MNRRERVEALAREIFARRHVVRWEESAPSSPARQEALREARQILDRKEKTGVRH